VFLQQVEQKIPQGTDLAHQHCLLAFDIHLRTAREMPDRNDIAERRRGGFSDRSSLQQGALHELHRLLARPFVIFHQHCDPWMVDVDRPAVFESVALIHVTLAHLRPEKFGVENPMVQNLVIQKPRGLENLGSKIFEVRAEPSGLPDGSMMESPKG
jgi:hypothetical protein